jgi:hypothetical protein
MHAREHGRGHASAAQRLADGLSVGHCAEQRCTRVSMGVGMGGREHGREHGRGHASAAQRLANGLSVGHCAKQICTRVSMSVGMPPQRSAWLMA